jgi:ABC-type transporter Mla maintaining outer membrane lipid asymmetry permease subunit MlaE
MSNSRPGAYARNSWQELRYLAALTWSIFLVAARRQTWKRTVRAELIRQVHSIGVRATRFVLYVSIAVGVSVVAQALVWMHKIGQTQLLGPLLARQGIVQPADRG